MPRTLLVTLELVVDHLPPDEIDDLDDGDPESALDDAEASEVAECLQYSCLDPDVFAGSSLWLKILQADVVSARWRTPPSASPSPQRSGAA